MQLLPKTRQQLLPKAPRMKYVLIYHDSEKDFPGRPLIENYRTEQEAEQERRLRMGERSARQIAAGASFEVRAVNRNF